MMGMPGFLSQQSRKRVTHLEIRRKKRGLFLVVAGPTVFLSI